MVLGLIGDVEGKQIVDVGCGDGALAVELASRGARVTGIDVSEAMGVPGVLAVFTGADATADGMGEVLPCAIPVKGTKGERLPSPGRPLLAQGRVRFVGDFFQTFGHP